MAVYYIASASSGGSSGNTGLTASSPWPMSKLGTFENPGDTIVIHKGDFLSGTSIFPRSGTSGNSITYDIYGSSAHNPIIDGAASSNAATSITGNFLKFNNLTLQNTTGGAGVVHLGAGVHDVVFNNCYVNNGILGINAVNCGTGGVANITIKNCWFFGITDVDDGSGGFKFGNGNHIQLNNVNGAGIEISGNNCYTPITIGTSTTPFVGDIISIFQSNGTSSSLILVHHNNIRGGGSSTTATAGKAGIVLGDVGGSYQYAHDNIVINGGSSGMLVQGGTFINMSNNKIYSDSQAYTSVGLAYGNYSGVAANNNTIGGNVTNFRDFHGNLANLYIDQATGSSRSTATGLVGGPTLALPTGWSTNTANSALDTSVSNSMLTDPLWGGTPWDTTVIPVFNYVSSVNSFINGFAILTIGPTVTSAYYAVTSYSISPALPTGLSFNTTSGAISGTPTTLSVNTNYTITANNIGGQNTTSISIQVLASGSTPFYRPIAFM